MPLDDRALAKLHRRYPSRRAVITGAGSGVGRALALALARHRWYLMLNDNAADRLASVVAECRSSGAAVTEALFDVAEPDAHRPHADAFLREHGGVDLVFTCAGIGVGGTFLDTAPEHFREVIDVNLLGTIWTGKVFLPAMVAAGKGHFVTIASAAAYHGLPGISAYAATKAAVVQLFRDAALGACAERRRRDRQPVPKRADVLHVADDDLQPIVIDIRELRRSLGRRTCEGPDADAPIQQRLDQIVAQQARCAGHECSLSVHHAPPASILRYRLVF